MTKIKYEPKEKPAYLYSCGYTCVLNIIAQNISAIGNSYENAARNIM